jgi:hypothetical protein
MNRADAWPRSVRLAGLHVAVMGISYVAALYVRLDGQGLDRYWASLRWFLLWVIAAALLFHIVMGAYTDRAAPGHVALAGALTMVVAVTLATRTGIPLSVAAAGSLLSSLGLIAIRFLALSPRAPP